MTGFLYVNKPKGITSFDVIRNARKCLKTRKIGHTGTLDPFAEGLVILAVGSFTKLVFMFDDMPKEYIAKGVFGETRDTDDIEGNKEEDFPLPTLSKETFAKHIKEYFSDEITQKPPKYSAVKINGKRAYKLARKGENVQTKERKVQIYDIQLLHYDNETFTIKTKVSRGTYIRSLVKDIALSVGSGAYTKELVRNAIGNINLNEALHLDEISESKLKPFTETFEKHPSFVINDPLIKSKILNGNKNVLSEFSNGRTAFLNEESDLLALAEISEKEKNYLYVKPN